MFRLRKITVWAPKPGRREMDHRDESIEESQILILRNREGVDGSPSRETVEMEKHFAQSQAVLGDLGAARRLTTLT
jgi:hypothetical protein